MVLETQRWLNKTYGALAAFEHAPEDGHTGWPTIYALREALQYETHSTAIGQGFGTATEAAVDSVVNQLKVGYSGNLVYLIEGAFWCKGINPGAFAGKYTIETQSAVEQLQRNAGVVANGVMTTQLMKALFDMSAFTLLQGGSSEIRSMQQYLNGKYHDYFGILPCDGIYQRETNTALIYALQATEGMPVGTANGYYGPGTATRTPVLSVGDYGEYVKIVQYGLMVNGFYSGPFDNHFSSEMGEAIKDFRKFMNLTPVNTTADLTVIKGLLTTNGNTNRDSIACDTAKQLNSTDIALLKRADFSVVGRYLTGTVGRGRNEKNKNLTSQELKLITDAGLRVFPIYQDGGADESYFTASQGDTDAAKAEAAAKKLGFPENTIIYFAVDADIEEGNIFGTALPYIATVAAKMMYYRVGIYGTRNVCEHAYEIGAVSACFVSDMSTGYSGNLGFKMPNAWAFDQFTEYYLSADLPIDQLASSGRDQGVSGFTKTTDSHVPEIIEDIVDAVQPFHIFKKTDFKISKSVHISDGTTDYYLRWSDDWNLVNRDGLGNLTISNEKVTIDLGKKIPSFPNVFEDSQQKQAEQLFNELAPKVGNGNIQAGPVIKNGRIGTKLEIKGTKRIDEGNEVEYSLIVEVYIRENNQQLPDPILEQIKGKIHQMSVNLVKPVHEVDGTFNVVIDLSMLAIILAGAYFGGAVASPVLALLVLSKVNI